jgi:tetratricopeptide (TPR) repeat protein
MDHFLSGRTAAALLLTAVLAGGCATTPPAQKPAATAHQTPIAYASNATTQTAPKDATGKEQASHSTSQSANAAMAKSFEDAVSRGDTAWQSAQADMAVYYYIQALSYKPRDINTLGKLGSIEQANNNLELAARAFQLAAEADPADPRLSGRLGLILLALGDEQKAEPWLVRSISTGNADWRVLDGLSVVEIHQARYRDGLQYAGEAIALAPDAGSPRLHAGEAQLGLGNLVSAEEHARAVLQVSKSPDAWRLLGRVQAKRRNYRDSSDSFLQFTAPADAYTRVAQAAMDNGDNAEAVRYFDKASAASPVYLADVQRNAAIARNKLDGSAGTLMRSAH